MSASRSTPSTSFSSDLSFWSQPDSPVFTLALSDSCLLDGASTPRDSTDSAGVEAGRKMFIFGTPVSQARAEDSLESTLSELNITGLDPLRDAHGKKVGPKRQDDSRRMMRETPSGRGGREGSGWVMYEDDGRIAEAKATEVRRVRGSSAPPPALSLKPVEAKAGEQGVRSPTGSKFKEELGDVPGSPLVWLKKAGGLRRSFSTDAIAQQPGRRRALWPKALRVLAGSRNSKGGERRVEFEPVPPDDRDLKQLAPRPLPFIEDLAGRPASQPVEAAKVAAQLRKRHTGMAAVAEAGRRLSNVFKPRSPEGQPRHRLLEDASLPPRSKSVPPGYNEYGLSFLPSEATSIVTPPDLPIFDAKNLGGQKLNPTQEFSYFQKMGMIQSPPPLSKPGEVCTPLDPMAQPTLSLPDNPRMTFTANLAEVAPFVEQDALCDRPAGGPSRELSPAFVRAQSARDSMAAARSKPAAVEEAPPRQTITRSQTSPAGRMEAAGPGRSRNSIVHWLSRTTKATPPPPPAVQLGPAIGPRSPEKPMEVVLELERREKRDTGVIGLNPEAADDDDDDGDGGAGRVSSDGDSYAAAARELVGLPRKKRADSGGDSLGGRGYD